MKKFFVFPVILVVFLVNSYGQNLIPVNINTNAITFSSDAGSISSLSYGITKNLELGTVNSNTLIGLDPATFYYVKGTISGFETNTGFYSTKSLSIGSIEVYFNHSPNNDFSDFTDAQHANFEDKIIRIISEAESTLDICVFYTKSKPIGKAINEAYNRGGIVRFIAGNSSLGDFPKNLNDDIEILQRKEPKGQMHNKFIIADVNSSLKSKVLITSANFTENNLFDDSNNLLIIDSP